MPVLKDMLEHSVVQLLTLFMFIGGFLLDYFNKNEYFFWAIIIVGVTLVAVYFDVKRIRRMYEIEVLPIPIVVNVGSDEPAKYRLLQLFTLLEEKTPFKALQTNLKRYRNLVEDDLTFTYYGDMYDKEQIKSFMQIIRYQLKKIKHATPNKVEFHVISYGRPSYSIFLGITLENEDVVVYQNDPDNDELYQAAVLDNRNYKNTIDGYEKFSHKVIKENETKDTLLVGLKASSHDINFNAPSLQKFENIVYLRANHEGTIERDEDWVRYNREVFTLLNQKQVEYKVIVLAHNMPESLGVMIGMSIGHYWNLKVLQYENSDYKYLMNTNEMKYYF